MASIEVHPMQLLANQAPLTFRRGAPSNLPLTQFELNPGVHSCRPAKLRPATFQYNGTWN